MNSGFCVRNHSSGVTGLHWVTPEFSRSSLSGTTLGKSRLESGLTLFPVRGVNRTTTQGRTGRVKCHGARRVHGGGERRRFKGRPDVQSPWTSQLSRLGRAVEVRLTGSEVSPEDPCSAGLGRHEGPLPVSDRDTVQEGPGEFRVSRCSPTPRRSRRRPE